jgi:hemerythrin
MTLMTMDNRLILRHATIDHNHQEMFDLIDLVALAVRSGPDNKVCIGFLNQLCQLARKHFAMEENLIQRYPHPQCDQHIAEHDSIISTINRLADRLEDGSHTPCSELPGQLRDVLSTHITHNDKTLVAILRCQDYATHSCAKC